MYYGFFSEKILFYGVDFPKLYNVHIISIYFSWVHFKILNCKILYGVSLYQHDWAIIVGSRPRIPLNWSLLGHKPSLCMCALTWSLWHKASLCIWSWSSGLRRLRPTGVCLDGGGGVVPESPVRTTRGLHTTIILQSQATCQILYGVSLYQHDWAIIVGSRPRIPLTWSLLGHKPSLCMCALTWSLWHKASLCIWSWSSGLRLLRPTIPSSFKMMISIETFSLHSHVIYLCTTV
jgi:hypothetical protein